MEVPLVWRFLLAQLRLLSLPSSSVISVADASGPSPIVTAASLKVYSVNSFRPLTSYDVIVGATMIELEGGAPSLAM